MRLKILIELLRSKQLFLLLRLSALVTPFYKLSYIASLVHNGFFAILAERPASLEELSRRLEIDASHAASLVAWLQVGVRLKEIALRDGKYALRGLSGALARSGNDALVAIVQEAASLHYTLISATPQKLRSGARWTLDDQDGEVVARSSRILEPLQREVITALFPATTPVRLLEVGCGSGVYIKHAATHNPQLTATGIELQPSVAEMARRNIAAWQLHDRVRIEHGDIRSRDFDQPFDIVTLYNNIYYFPVAERTALLQHLRNFLKPGGFLVLTTGCQGGQPMMELLNLWGVSTEGCDRLPYMDEMIEHMRAAGFRDARAMNPLPGDSFAVFVGYR